MISLRFTFKNSSCLYYTCSAHATHASRMLALVLRGLRIQMIKVFNIKFKDNYNISSTS